MGVGGGGRGEDSVDGGGVGGAGGDGWRGATVNAVASDRYRKKPIVISAIQWHGFERGPHNLGIVPLPTTTPLPSNLGWMDTLEGGHVVTPEDWIITGVKGERYPCKPDIFEATYESVDVSLT